MDLAGAESGHEEPSDAESFFKNEVYKMNSGRFKNDPMTEEELGTARELLNEQFAKDLLESIQQKTIPDFIPFPEYPEVLDPLSLNATSIEQDAPFGNNTQTQEESSETKSDKEKKEDASVTDKVLDTLFTSIQNFNPINYVPEKVVSWLTAAVAPAESPERNHEGKSRRKRGTNEVDVDQTTRSIVKDIRNLFSIISFLDISRCLEKMVCEIHNNGKQITTGQLANSYEGKIITAFR